MIDDPFIRVTRSDQAGTSALACAYFAIRLDSIGVCKQEESHAPEYAARLLNRQTDFIAMLPALGEGNAAELRFVGRPVPVNPILGSISAYLRVRITGASEADAGKRALANHRQFLANLRGISDTYHWKPVTGEEEYLSAFDGFEAQYIAELLQRERRVDLERMRAAHDRKAMGFSADSGVRSSEERRGDAVVHVTFPFVRSYDRLDRLFGILLMQDAPVAVSVALSPTRLRDDEMDFLMHQIEQCERYLQLPLDGPVSQPSLFLPVLKEQARRVLGGLQRRVYELADDSFLLKVQVASPRPIAPGLMEAVGVTVTEHVGSTDIESDARHDGGVDGGGYDWIEAGDDSARTTARGNFAQMEFDSWAPTLAPAPGNRLRWLVTPPQANAAFRFPVPLATEFPGLETRLYRTAPVATGVPEKGVALGVNEHLGFSQPVRLATDDRRRHAYVVGQTGVGKSSLLQNLIMQDIRNGDGVGVLDPHGELVDAILARIPPDRVGDVVYINPENQDRIVGLNLLQARDELDRDSAINHLIEIFYKLYDMRQAGGPVFEMNIRNAALLAMADPDDPATLSDIMRVFLDKDFRNRRLDRCRDPLVTGFWKEIALKIKSNDYSLADMAAYVGSKLARLTHNSLMRNIVLQERSTIDFAEVMDRRRILLVDLCKGKLGETNSSFLAMILVSLLQRAAFARSPRNDTADFFLYVDEFQNVATENFVTLLSEARKYRLNLVLANQYLHQIPEETRAAVLGNVGTLVAFRVGAKDAEILEQEFLPVSTRADLINLPNYHAYVRTLFGGAVTRPFNIRTHLDTMQPEAGVASRVMEKRLDYTVPREDVEAAIARRWAGPPAGP